MKTILHASLLAAMCAIMSPTSDAARQDVQAVVSGMPAGDRATAEKAYATLIAMGPNGIRDVCARIIPPGTGDDSKSRFLLSGLAFHVNRPDARKERAMVESVLLSSLEAAGDREVRAFFIRQLRWCGTSASASPLAVYLRTPELCEDAAFTLQSIKGAAAENAIVTALASADEKVAATLLRAAGQMRCLKAVPMARTWAQSDASELRLVAQFALAGIGDAQSISLLMDRVSKGSWYERSQTVSHYLLLARRLADDGRRDDAAAMCRELAAMKSDVLMSNVRCGALSVLADVAGAGATDDLVAAFDDPAPDIRATALHVLGGLPGAETTQRIAECLPRARAAETRRVIAELLGSRGDAGALPVLAAAMRDGDADVRTAAIRACGGIGGAAAADVLVACLADADRAMSAAVERTLSKLNGDGLNARIADNVRQSGAGTKVVLLRVLAARQAVDHVDVVLTALGDGDADVRMGALDALRTLGSEQDMGVLVAYLLKAAEGEERKHAIQSVAGVGRRIADGRLRSAAAVRVWKTSSDAQRVVLLDLLPELGGAEGLQLITSSLADSVLRDAAVRALSAWPEAEAVPPLMELARTGKTLTHRVLALRGCVRLAGDGALPGDERLRILSAVLATAERVDEKRLAIAALAGVSLPSALTTVGEHLHDADLQREAAVAVATLATGEGSIRLTAGDVPGLQQALALLPQGELQQRLKATIAALPDPNDPNLALRRSVRTSCAHQGHHVPSDAVDGDAGLTSGWWGVQYPSWLAVDLGQTVMIGKVRAVFYFGDDRYYLYTIDVSLDGKTWQPVVDNSKTTEPCRAEGVLHTFEPVSARHVRINVLKNSANPAVHLLELQVFAPDK